jgi:hypothetical protein
MVSSSVAPEMVFPWQGERRPTNVVLLACCTVAVLVGVASGSFLGRHLSPALTLRIVLTLALLGSVSAILRGVLSLT